jgi:hypothetical protein
MKFKRLWIANLTVTPFWSEFETVENNWLRKNRKVKIEISKLFSFVSETVLDFAHEGKLTKRIFVNAVAQIQLIRSQCHWHVFQDKSWKTAHLSLRPISINFNPIEKRSLPWFFALYFLYLRHIIYFNAGDFWDVKKKVLSWLSLGLKICSLSLRRAKDSMANKILEEELASGTVEHIFLVNLFGVLIINSKLRLTFFIDRWFNTFFTLVITMIFWLNVIFLYYFILNVWCTYWFCFFRVLWLWVLGFGNT